MDEQPVILNELKLAFLHLAKTGGQSFQDFLSERFKRKFLLNSPDYAKDFKIHNFGHFNLIAGHHPYGCIKLPRCFQYVTILRDPVQRTISQYNHLMHGKTSLHIAEEMRAKKCSFSDFISNLVVQNVAWTNHYTVYLSNYEPEKNTFDVIKKTEEAVYNLAFNFDFVGITERMDETIELFNRKYAINSQIGVIGKTPQSHKTEITEEDIKKANFYLTSDLTIYDTAINIFEDALHKYGITK